MTPCPPARGLRMCEWSGWYVVSATGSLALRADTRAPIPRKTHCNHRLCDVCAPRRANKKRFQLAPLVASLFAPAVLTLTQRSIPGESLRMAADGTVSDEPELKGRRSDGALAFLPAFGKMARSKWFKDHVAGYFLAIEPHRSTPQTRRNTAARKKRLGQKVQDGRSIRRESTWNVHGHAILELQPCSSSSCLACTDWDHQLGEGTYGTLAALRATADRLGREARIPGPGVTQRRELAREAREEFAETVWVAREDGARRSGYLHQRELSARWEAALDGDGRTDIKRPFGLDAEAKAHNAVNEVVKYALKGEDVDALDDDELSELCGWMRNRRLMRAGGLFRSIEEPTEEVEVEDPVLDERFLGVDAYTGEPVTITDCRISNTERVQVEALAREKLLLDAEPRSEDWRGVSSRKNKRAQAPPPTGPPP